MRERNAVRCEGTLKTDFVPFVIRTSGCCPNSVLNIPFYACASFERRGGSVRLILCAPVLNAADVLNTSLCRAEKFMHSLNNPVKTRKSPDIAGTSRVILRTTRSFPRNLGSHKKPLGRLREPQEASREIPEVTRNFSENSENLKKSPGKTPGNTRNFPEIPEVTRSFPEKSRESKEDPRESQEPQEVFRKIPETA